MGTLVQSCRVTEPEGPEELFEGGGRERREGGRKGEKNTVLIGEKRV